MAHELIAELHQLGIRLRFTDGRLDVLAPAGALTPQLRERLRLRRDELIGLLQQADTGAEEARLQPAPEQRDQPFSLTDIQHAYWVGRGSAVELGGVSSHYYFELERAGLDPIRLHDSLNEVIARHDMLRMRVRPDGQQQILTDVPKYEIVVNDLRDLTPEMRQKELAGVRSEMDHQVLPADRWPLFDIRASLVDDDRIRLHVSLDVLILDGMSLYLLFEEWRRYYEQPDWAPEPLTMSYRDYVLYEERQRQGSGYAAAEQYWSQRLDFLPPAPALPHVKQPSRLARTEFVRRHGRVPADQWSAVKQAAQQRGFTPSSVLMTAFADVLRLWSGQPAFTLNLTLFNRPQVHPQINKVIGDFTSVTLLEVQSAPEECFRARVERLQRQLMQDLANASYSGVRVLRERGRRLGGGPGAAMPVVFTSALVLGSGDGDPAAGIRFFGDETYAITQTPQVWLDHQVAEEAGDLVFSWDAVEALFPAGLLDDMFATYCAVLDRLCRDDATWDRTGPVATLPQWQLDERSIANDTAAEIPARSLCELVEESARQRPDAVAVLADDGRLTYDEVVSHARRLAHRLVDLGATPNTLVGVVLDKGWRQVPAVVGINQSGAAYLPIDPQWPEPRRRHLLEQGGVRVVVTTAALRDELSWPAGISIVTFDDVEVAQGPSDPLSAVPTPTDLAYVIFTSGSTGQPKGVMIDNRGAANTVQNLNERFAVGPGDRVLALSALSFDLSVYDIFGPLAAGGAVVMPSAGQVHDLTGWTDLMRRHEVTIWNSVPALMQAWVEAQGRSSDPSVLGLRLVLLSGDWIPVALPDAVRALLPSAAVISLGGATEASIWSVYYPIDEVPPDWSRIPYGKALANQTMHVLDHELESCPVWTTGEIYIGGIGVAQGYWADPERTAERFVVHPVTNTRLYRTGDLGRFLPGGDIEFLGRQDTQVKLNGYRIELDEIAAHLRRLTGVAEAVVGVDTNPATGRRHLVAHVVPDRDGLASAGDPAGIETWRKMLGSGAAEVRRCLTDLDTALSAYRASWRAIEDLCPLIMARTLAQLGLFHSANDMSSSAETVIRHGLKPRYQGLIEQWFTVLTDQGVLTASGSPDEYRCVQPLDVAALDDRIAAGFAELGSSTASAVLVDYVRRCADNQVAMLRGEVTPLQLLFGASDSTIADALYADNPVSLLQNRVAARVVRAFVERNRAGRPARILEVGAGTGATTAQILQELPRGQVHYSFTDVSTYFTKSARLRFRAHPHLDYGVFDIDRNPSTQGVALGSVDLIVAANVMHDAKHLDESLRHLASALRPGGVLLLIEGTANSLVQMISVGFIEGLGNYQDQRTLPLLAVPQWQERLHAAGFARSASIPEGEPAVDVHVQHVLIASTPAAPPGLDAASLREALEGQLPDYMVPRHFVVVDRLPLNANGKVDRSGMRSPWSGLTPDERVAPSNDIERELFRMWSEALGRDDFGVRDNFFELGGDSLHAVGILGQLREHFGVDISADEGLELLFDQPTIADLAVVLSERAGS